MKRWRKEDDEFIRNNSHMTLIELSNKMGRSTPSVQFRKDKICVKLKGDVERWTEKDIQFLIDNNSTMNNYVIAEKLGRTPTAVRRKINKLGLTAERALISDETRWAKKEDVLLIKNKDMPIKKLLPMFNRTRQAIYHRKHVLGCKKYKLWFKTEIQTVKDNLHKTDREIAKLINRSESSIKSKRRSLQVLKREPNEKWSEKDEKYLIKNQHLGYKKINELLGMEKRRVYNKMLEMGLLKTR